LVIPRVSAEPWCLAHVGTADTRLAKGFGNVFGHDPRSYRAEAHGAKAVTLFLLHCFRYCDLTLPPGLFKFYCDNQGLLNKLLYMRSYRSAVYATCLHSEWDIVSSVHRLHSCFPSLPELLHVKGHQDDNIPAAFLDLPGQLNVEADKLATHALQELGSPKPYIPFDPSTEVLLTIDGRTVTRQLGATIHAQHHLAPICKYYKQRFLWELIHIRSDRLGSILSSLQKISTPQDFLQQIRLEKATRRGPAIQETS
jgi:hypothetical protein